MVALALLNGPGQIAGLIVQSLLYKVTLISQSRPETLKTSTHGSTYLQVFASGHVDLLVHLLQASIATRFTIAEV